MALRAWMLAAVVAASTPQASHAIRQEAAAEVLALPLAPEGSDAEGKGVSQLPGLIDTASRDFPLPQEPSGGHEGSWMRVAGPLMRAAWEQPAAGPGVEPSFFTEQRWEDGTPALPTPAGASRHRRHRRPVQAYWWDKDGIPCVPLDWNHLDYGPPHNDKFLYDDRETCHVAYMCAKVEGYGLIDDNQKPCDPVNPSFGVAPAGASHRRHHRPYPSSSRWYDKNGRACVPEDLDHVDCSQAFCDKFLYDSGEACTPARWCVKGHHYHEYLDENNNHCDPDIFGGRASAMDDPHLVSLVGERFDVKRPGHYSLLRVPLGDQGDATATHHQPLLAVDTDLRAPEGAPCGLYIKMVTLSGRWLEGRVVRIRPSGDGRANKGSSKASSGGGARHRPLSVQVGAPASGAADEWPWAPFGGSEANDSLREASTQMVRALAVRREELGPFGEGQAFTFELLASRSGWPPASITVSQGSHKALNVALEGMAGLGHARFGGLLGTELHDRALEVPLEECRQSRAQGASRLLGLVDTEASGDFPLSWDPSGHEGSRMQASWDRLSAGPRVEPSSFTEQRWGSASEALRTLPGASRKGSWTLQAEW